MNRIPQSSEVESNASELQAVQQDAERFAAIFKHLDDLIMIFDRDGCARYVSPSSTRVTGFPPDAALGQHYRDMSHRDDHAAIDQKWQHLLQRPGLTERIRYRSVHATQKWLIAEASITAHFDTPGIEGMLVLVRDVSEQVSAEEKLRHSEETLRRAQAIGQVGSWSLDVTANELAWSEETYRIFGIPAGTPMTLERFFECIHPADRDMVAREWEEALRGQPYDIGHRIVVNGQTLWVHEKADLQLDATGQLLAATGTVQEVTTQHQAATQLTELLEFNEKVIAETPIGIAVYRADGPCVIANEALARILGSSLDDARGQNFRRIPSWRLLGLLDAAMDALQLNKSVRTMATGLSSFGKAMALDCEMVPITRQGEPHLLVLTKDIADFRATEQALKEASLMAEEASRAKSEFLANMSHEIRTPMNAVIGLAQLALDRSNDPALNEYLKQMYSSASALLNIINDILDYSKIESGRLEIENRSFNLRDLTAHFVGTFRHAADQRSIQLKTEIADDVPLRLVGDSVRLGQVLVNLGSNALKFTAQGAVTLQISRLASADFSPGKASGTARLRFSVTDTGIGMSQDAVARLFQPFVQADGSITRRFGGTGLGLTISRRLVILMGGDISVDSATGQGSRFQFDLDFALPEQPPLAITPTAPVPSAEQKDSVAQSIASRALPIAGACILLVEDDPINQKVINGLLTRAGLHVVVANHGGEALDQLSAPTAPPVEAVVMDLQMPVVDGFEATRRIRENPAWASLPIIAHTAGVLIHDREKCLAAGMTDFVAKPVKLDELLAILLRHVPHRTGKPAVARSFQEPAPVADLTRLIATLDQLGERLTLNEFVAVAEIAELRAQMLPFASRIGVPAANLEEALSRFDYATAKVLLAELLSTLR
jgi:PAS domain S-box-containing protein